MVATVADRAAEETVKKPVKASEPVLRGRRAIVWNPKNDIICNQMIGNSKPVRGYSYSWSPGFEAGNDRPIQIKTVHLPLVGLNWVDAQLWAEAVADSKTRIDVETGVRDPLSVRMAAGAIKTFEPKAGLFNLSGSLVDYDDAIALLLTDEIFDADILRGEMKSFPQLIPHLQRRIAQLESGEIVQ